MTVEPLLTIAEVAAFLNVKESKIRAMIFQRELKIIKVGHLVRFRAQDIREWIENRAATSVNKPVSARPR